MLFLTLPILHSSRKERQPTNFKPAKFQIFTTGFHLAGFTTKVSVAPVKSEAGDLLPVFCL